MTASRERLGVLGGSFNPVHLGHLHAALLSREAARLDRVLFVPAARSLRKPGLALAPAFHRTAMLDLALESEPGCEVCGIELEPEGPAFTVDTLDALRQRYAGARFHFILGLDSLRDLPNWRDPDGILTRHAVIAVDRPGCDPGEVDPGLAARVRLVRGNPLAISSSLVRERAAAGLSLRHLVSPGVEAYLTEHPIYSRGAS